MKQFIKRILLKLFLPYESRLTRYSVQWITYVRNQRLEKSENVFMKQGFFPLFDHYYQPLINPKRELKRSLREDRNLPGLDMNVEQQLQILGSFNYNDELLAFPEMKEEGEIFYYNNGSFCSGDAEYFYNVVRTFKPERIIEIGSGMSTLMARNAIHQNKQEDNGYACKQICIEPYEQPWLEKMDVLLKREKVENIPVSFFEQLGENDILFIDSSHIIRPQGDVLFEYLEILPILKPGVLVHVHDIFTPKDYLDEWVHDHYLWNEQYLLEAFLCFNDQFKVVGALNYLSHNHTELFASKCPVFAKQKGREPGSFWMVKERLTS